VCVPGVDIFVAGPVVFVVSGCRGHDFQRNAVQTGVQK
jgi:hypothetical protein